MGAIKASRCKQTTIDLQGIVSSEQVGAVGEDRRRAERKQALRRRRVIHRPGRPGYPGGVQLARRGGIDLAMTTGACAAPPPATWVSPDYPAFSVTVACTSTDFNDGETAPGTARVLRVFTITATACNGGPGGCPNDPASAGIGYVERERVAVVACQSNGTVCTGPP
jgi:hypothetical protein